MIVIDVKFIGILLVKYSNVKNRFGRFNVIFVPLLTKKHVLDERVYWCNLGFFKERTTKW